MNEGRAHYRSAGIPFCKLPKRIARLIARKSAKLLAKETEGGHMLANAMRAVGKDVPLVCGKCAAIVWPEVEKVTGQKITYEEVTR